MAELLVKAISGNARSYQEGDVVVAMPDNHTWGRAECLPDFYRANVSDMTTDEAQYLLEELPDARRRWAVNMSLVFFDEAGIASLNRAAFLGVLVDKGI